eukprot:2798086-Pyramimonas_sp.AAC.1
MHRAFNIADGDIQTAKAVSVLNRRVQMGDVCAYVLADGRIGFGQVWFHCAMFGETLTCVSAWQVYESLPGYVKCLAQDAPELVQSSSLLEACVFTPAQIGKVVQVLLPPRLQHRLECDA